MTTQRAHEADKRGALPNRRTSLPAPLRQHPLLNGSDVGDGSGIGNDKGLECAWCVAIRREGNEVAVILKVRPADFLHVYTYGKPLN